MIQNREIDPLSLASKINFAALALLFQSNFSSFFSVVLSNLPVWRFSYYSIVVSAVVFSVLTVVSNKIIARSAAPIAVFIVSSVLVALLHPTDHIAKNFFVGLAILICVFILAHRAGPVWAFQCSAIATAFTALLCLIDTAIPELFGNTTGRATGFVGNANDAAMQLLLGLIVAAPALPIRIRPGFVILISAAIVATLSRSTLLVASVVLLCSLIQRPEMRAAIRSAARARGARVFAALVVLWVMGAAFWNVGNDSIVDRIGRAPGAMQSFVSSLAPLWTAPIRGGASDPGSLLAEEIRLTEQNDSSAARGLYLRRSISAFLNGPATGVGLAEAFSLSPHNTYILFGVAFGTIGFAIPAMMVLLVFAYCRRSFGMPVAILALMLCSHNILFFPAIMMLISLGMLQKL